MFKTVAVLVALVPASLGIMGTDVASAEPKPTSVTIGALDFSFEAPPTLPGGRVKVTLDNKGAEVHQVDFIKLDPGVDMAGWAAAAAANFQGSRDVSSYKGGPNSAAPGERTSSTQALEPGNYLIGCLIPSPDGVPHALKGMLQPITIEAPPKPASQRAPKATKVRLQDYNFDPGPSFDGTGTIDIINRGDELHELVLGKLDDGKTIQDVIAFGSQPLFQPHTIAQPYEDVGGITPIDPGGRSRIKVGKLSPGDYGLFCFIPDAQGVAHVELGMVYPFTVD